MQGRNRDADIEDELVDTGGEGEGGQVERATLRCVYPTVCKVDS